MSLSYQTQIEQVDIVLRHANKSGNFGKMIMVILDDKNHVWSDVQKIYAFAQSMEAIQTIAD